MIRSLKNFGWRILNLNQSDDNFFLQDYEKYLKSHTGKNSRKLLIYKNVALLEFYIVRDKHFDAFNDYNNIQSWKLIVKIMLEKKHIALHYVRLVNVTDRVGTKMPSYATATLFLSKKDV